MNWFARFANSLMCLASAARKSAATGTRASRAAPARRWPRSFRPECEILEDRCLLAAWTAIGPAPQLLGGLAVGNSFQFGKGNSAFSGRITALAVSNDYDGLGHSAFFVGTSGGLFRSIDFVNN